MKTLRSIGPIAAVIGLVVLNGLASRASELLPVLLVGLGLLSGSAWVWSRTRAFLATAWNADGTVVALQRGRGRTRNGMFPVVQFSTVTGEEVRFTGGFGTNFSAWPVGQQVTVRYDPHKPANARIQSLAQLWFLPALLGFVGSIFTIVWAVLVVA
jgi:hypothetical protein